MRAWFLGQDSESQVDNSPALFATDRTDRKTYIAQGWKVTDPQILAEVVNHSPIADHEAVFRLPARMRGIVLEAVRGSEGSAVQ